ncbi:MAG: LamG domain-containing protein [Armatimonadetes bacterium]|nr:LamG domain-containing protein [Armatimonadota bacterium]
MLSLGLLLLTAVGLRADAQVNLLPNPSFELVEPPPPRAGGGGGPEAPADEWVPRTWDIWSDGAASCALPDDPAQARTGRRCVHLRGTGGAAHLQYYRLPDPDGRQWTVRFSARGHGLLAAVAIASTASAWTETDRRTFELGPVWQEYAYEVKPLAAGGTWVLRFELGGDSEAWIDDVFAGYDGLNPLGLPPDAPAGHDENTLLYLHFEESLNEDAFFLSGQVMLTGPEEGRFRRALSIGPDGYVACSANENLDPQRGTIELWFKLLSPGNDTVYRPFVQVPGPEGMSLHKDQYSHIGFGFSSGWRAVSWAHAEGYAHRWQPGVWRHIAACWDKDLMQVFVDGKLIAWKVAPKLLRTLGPELRIGSPDMLLDDLRISKVVRYRIPVPPE